MASPSPIDKENMYKLLKQFPQQVREGSKLGTTLKLEKCINKIVIGGMGGSALPGEVLQSFLDEEIPVFINRDYSFPRYVDNKSLVFIISYSGNTEEALSMLDDAKKKGAQIVIITSGGKLREKARKDKIPFIEIPHGLPPRMTLGYLVLPMLNILIYNNIVKDYSSELPKTIAILEKPIYEEKAKKIARKLKDKIPVIYTSNRMKAIAYKWKIDFNENSKTNAYYNIIPEMNHNEILGYTNLTADFFTIILKDDEDNIRNRKRMEITSNLIKKRATDVLEISIIGNCKLAKLFSGIYLGDWTSYFLALEYDTDPTPVKIIEELKKSLIK